MNRLLEIGFQPVGNWKLDGDDIVCELTRLMNNRNVLYAFVVEGAIKYIGKTTQPLKKRMSGYQNPGPTQKTNIKNRINIFEQLKKGYFVDILVLPDNGLLRYGGFHINLAAGLEDSLISQLRPEWNGQRLSKASSEPEEKPPQKTAKKTLEKTTFLQILHKTYYNSGFFNVPVQYDRHFGNNLDKIDIYCGNEEVQIVGYINRSANQNKTPRIMGGVELKNWLQNKYQITDQVLIEVLSPTSIKILDNRG